MKILIITDFYYRGGLETFIYNLLQSWDEKDSFNIICNDNNPSIKFLTIRHPRFIENDILMANYTPRNFNNNNKILLYYYL